MVRLQSKSCGSIFLPVLLVLAVISTAQAAQENKTDKNQLVVEHTAAQAMKNDSIAPAAQDTKQATEQTMVQTAGQAVGQTAGQTAGTEKSDVAAKSEVKNYLYDPTGKTDPFKTFLVTKAEKESKEKSKPKTYLETMELSQLDLVVIVISPRDKWAMVKDSKGLGHVIKEGTPIGTNNGVVYKINKGEVVIREEYTDFKGQKQFRDVSKLSQSQ